MVQDEAARLMRNKLESFAAEEEATFGSCYASVVWGRLEKGMRDGYVGAIKQFSRYSRIHGWLGRREAMEGKLVHIAREGFCEGPVKMLSSRLRLAKKPGIIDTLVQVFDCIFVKS